jgi:type IV pilus assembly protein PilA
MNSSPTERREDKGFTLIELMVVVLIIAILLAIAIPTFLGAQNKAKDRSAQSSARNALTNAKTIYADASTYVPASGDAVGIAALKASEPSLNFVIAATPSTDPKMVSVAVVTNKDTWYAAVWSLAGNCMYIKDSVASGGPGTMYGKGTVALDCTGSEAKTLDVGAFYKADW